MRTDVNKMNNREKAFSHKLHKKRSCFRIKYFSLSKGVLIGCLVISWTCFTMVAFNIIPRSPSNEIFDHLRKSSDSCKTSTNFYSSDSRKNSTNFYSIGSPEIGRVASINFPDGKVYHVNSIGYDKYSISELGQTNVARQWLTFPLPDELNRSDYPSPWYPSNQSSNDRIVFPVKKSPPTLSDLAYVEQIYVITDQSFIARHQQLKKTFLRHSIPVESIDFRWKWNRTTCQMKENKDEIRRKLNPEIIGRIRRKYCPIVMKHVDVWHEMVERQISLGLILEDDPIFVPFFKDKLNRVIYTAIRTGALRLNKICLNQTQIKIDDREWINQEPMFVIGICYDMFDGSFQNNVPHAQPIITPHKQNASRCAHAYLLTSCTAKAMIDTIANHPTNVDTPDFYLNFVYPRSSVLQSFWVDPPLVYQGNRVIDLEHLETYSGSMYNKRFRK